MIIAFVICPTAAQKNPLTQTCRPQHLHFRGKNPSNRLFAVRRWIRLMTSLGARAAAGCSPAGAQGPCSLRPHTVRISTASHACLTSSRVRSAILLSAPCIESTRICGVTTSRVVKFADLFVEQAGIPPPLVPFIPDTPQILLLSGLGQRSVPSGVVEPKVTRRALDDPRRSQNVSGYLSSSSLSKR